MADTVTQAEADALHAIDNRAEDSLIHIRQRRNDLGGRRFTTDDQVIAWIRNLGVSQPIDGVISYGLDGPGGRAASNEGASGGFISSIDSIEPPPTSSPKHGLPSDKDKRQKYPAVSTQRTQRPHNTDDVAGRCVLSVASIESIEQKLLPSAPAATNRRSTA